MSVHTSAGKKKPEFILSLPNIEGKKQTTSNDCLQKRKSMTMAKLLKPTAAWSLWKTDHPPATFLTNPTSDLPSAQKQQIFTPTTTP
jgi:hypothetical protein